MRFDDAGGNDPRAARSLDAIPDRPFAFATVMTLTAGFLDAVGFTHLAGLYVSFMSGNSTRLGIVIAHGDQEALLPVALVISSFVLGAFLGSIVGDVVGRFRTAAILAVEIGLLVSSIALISSVDGYAGLLPVCVAMGMQNAARETVAGVEIGKGFVTGLLFGLGKALALLVRGHAGRAQVLVYGVSWASFLCGVTLGSVTLAHLGLAVALLIASTVLALLAIAVIVDQRRTPAFTSVKYRDSRRTAGDGR
ncbi:YoaK family protein [Rhodopseudomonas sp. NSM]|uniref:YoaK family protein n=1 Tax=Rhodopseudomonas sp. NSM TaxID=3457630 RepID=UPI0040351257